MRPWLVVAALLFVLTNVIVRTHQSPELRTAISKAKKNGLDSIFLKKVTASSDATFHERAVMINVTNYASKPDYKSQYNRKSVKTVKAFMAQHQTLLRSVQKKTSVPKEVVASILWIESKCGQNFGKYHVPSVFLSVILAADSQYVQKSINHVFTSTKTDSSEIDSVRALIQRRANKKVQWALVELKALQEIDKRKVMNVSTLKGSWAGAFGFPQFLPSSYLSWAVDGDGDGDIDLYTLSDAAHSIGNYLKANGWGPKKLSKRAAVHHYNNSDAYVNAVFTLAGKLTPKTKRRK